MVKNLPANAGDTRDTGSIPWWGRSLGGGHGNPCQYSCLENPMDRRAWRATVHGVTESDMIECTHIETPKIKRMVLTTFKCAFQRCQVHSLCCANSAFMTPDKHKAIICSSHSARRHLPRKKDMCCYKDVNTRVHSSSICGS